MREVWPEISWVLRVLWGRSQLQAVHGGAPGPMLWKLWWGWVSGYEEARQLVRGCQRQEGWGEAEGGG